MKLLGSNDSDVSLLLPFESVDKFSELFTQLEKDQELIGVQSYGVAMTTLEDVFLRITRGETNEGLTKYKSFSNFSYIFSLKFTKIIQ